MSKFVLIHKHNITRKQRNEKINLAPYPQLMRLKEQIHFREAGTIVAERLLADELVAAEIRFAAAEFEEVRH